MSENYKEAKLLKLKSVKVSTPMGEKRVTMVPVLVDPNHPIEESLCAASCPYGNICDKLRDPRDPENPDKTLQDWCVDCSFDGENYDTVNEFGSSHPAEGTIETLYSEDSDSFKQLMKLNPIINLNTFIDNVCPGFCSFYNKDHSECSMKNEFCICKSLFVRKMNNSWLNRGNSENKTEETKE